ncbi:hypothetical protein TNCT_403061 [Trichonephila clavata]|uniref:Uncharacterized protein n=1 Tax=Trichonephila clavata TaxID=2740835 RepID=A0A8X6FDB0_TRICU|nr:hypothetical protein TNCT_403061 [Trichonephila clavata]
MEDSTQLENTARIFATQLVHCVMRKYIPSWIPEVAVEDVNIFPDSIKTEIEMTCELNSTADWWEFHQNFIAKEKTNASFEKFCSRKSSLIQHEENTEAFFTYAANLAKFSTLIYDNVVEAPNIAIGHITDVLIAQYPSLCKTNLAKNDKPTEP